MEYVARVVYPPHNADHKESALHFSNRANDMRHLFLKNRNLLIISILFYVFFLLLTPLDLFNKEIPPDLHTDFFSIIKFDLTADDGGHYAYLRSLFFDHDIDFFNEPSNSMMRPSKITGYIDNPWPIGASVLWLPFFLFGHLATIILNNLGHGLNTDGYSFPYISMIALGSISYGFLGTLLIYKSLCNFFKAELALFATISTFFSSPMVYYVYIRSHMDISLDFFNLSLFIYLFIAFALNKPHNKLFYLFFGIVCGIMSISRFNGIIYTTSFIIYLSGKFVLKIKRKETITWMPIVNHLCLMAMGFFIAILPQLIVNSTLNGSLLNPGPTVGMNFHAFKLSVYIHNFVNIFIGKVGILVMSPICGIGILGFIMLFFKIRQNDETSNLFYISIFLGFLLQVLLTARLAGSGSEYGIKFLSSSSVFIMFGVAALLEYLQGRRKTVFFVIGALLLIGWQYIQLIQYRVVVPRNEFSIFKVPLDFYDIISNNVNFLLRSSNIINLLIHGCFRVNTIIDFYFLVFIPLFLATIMVSVLLWKNVFLNLVKNKITIISINIFFISLGSLLLIQPKKTREEIEKRYLLHQTIDRVTCKFNNEAQDLLPGREVLIKIENSLQDYYLGIKTKDDNYCSLLDFKNWLLSKAENRL